VYRIASRIGKTEMLSSILLTRDEAARLAIVVRANGIIARDSRIVVFIYF